MYGTCFRHVLLEGQVDSSKVIKYCLADARQALKKKAEAAGNLLNTPMDVNGRWSWMLEDRAARGDCHQEVGPRIWRAHEQL